MKKRTEQDTFVNCQYYFLGSCFRTVLYVGKIFIKIQLFFFTNKLLCINWNNNALLTQLWWVLRCFLQTDNISGLANMNYWHQQNNEENAFTLRANRWNRPHIIWLWRLIKRNQTTRNIVFTQSLFSLSSRTQIPILSLHQRGSIKFTFQISPQANWVFSLISHNQSFRSI